MKANSIVLVIIAAFLTASCVEKEKIQPNILIIQPDQHRADVMGCAGNSTAITPNLDKLMGYPFQQCCQRLPGLQSLQSQPSNRTVHS